MGSRVLGLNMGDHELLDLQEWALILNKMLRYHFNISEDIKQVVQSIRTEMRPELIPLAEEKANFGKLVKTAVREMWGLEYEVDELQSKFSDSIGTMGVDIIEVQARNRQKAKLEEIKKTYGEAIKDLEVMIVERPPKGADVKPAEGAEEAAAEKPAE